MKVSRFLVILFVAAFAMGTAWAAPTLPPGPPFDSVLAAPPDEGTVRPVTKVSPRPMKIAFICLESSAFFVPVKNAVLKAAAELKSRNCTVDWINAGEKHTTDVFGQAVDAAVAQNYDAIATIAGDSGMVNYINRAVDAGIPVATFNSETAAPNKRLFFVGADLYLQGKTAGETMAKLLGNKGKVAIITGFFAVESHELRRKGFEDALAKNAPAIRIVGRVEDKDEPDTAFGQANDFMTANPDLNGLFVAAGGNFGAAKAVKEAGKAGKVHIVCYDFVDETMAYVKEGVIDGTIGQDPYAQGHDPVIRLYNYLVGGVVPKAAKLLTRADFVTKDNMDKYWSPSK